MNLSTFFQDCSLPMAITDVRFNFIDINDNGCAVIGYKRNDIIGKSFFDITPKGGLKYDIEKMQMLIAGKINSYTIRRKYRTKTGDLVEGFVTVSKLKIDSKEPYIVGVFHEKDSGLSKSGVVDINYNFLGRILSLNPDFHYIMDVENKSYVYQNMDILKHLGYSDDDLGDKNPIEFALSKVNKEKYHELVNAGREFGQISIAGKFAEAEFQIEAKDKSWHWLKSRSTPLIQDSQGKTKLSYGIIQDITERKEVEEKLKAQDSFINQVINFIPDIVYVYDYNSREEIYSNYEKKLFLGYTKDEWKSGVVRPNPIHDKELEIAYKNLEKLKSDEHITNEISYDDKEGNTHWLLTKSKVFKRNENGEVAQVLVIISNVTELKNALIELQIATNTNAAIIEAIPDLLLVVNREGIYTKVFGGVDLKLDQSIKLQGLHLGEILTKKTADLILKLIPKVIKSGKTELIHFKHNRILTGEEAYFSNYISKLNENEVLILAREETEKVEAQLALDEKMNLLFDKNKQLEQFIHKNAELEKFAYIISHDLKEPLRSITAISELIEKEVQIAENDKLKTLLKHLSENSSRMVELIDGVLSYSKYKSDIVQTKLDLNKVLTDVQKDIKTFIEQKNANIQVDELPTLRGNKIQIRQLFQNLLSNAIKFNDNEQPKVEVKCKQLDKGYEFTIADNGIGIPQDQKHRIFDMFNRGGQNGKYGGQGIGLSICKKIVENHHGQIQVESEENKGTSFIFTLFND